MVTARNESMLGILQKKVDETYREFRHNYKRKKSEEPQLQPSKLGMGTVGVNSLLGLLLINAPWWETKAHICKSQSLFKAG